MAVERVFERERLGLSIWLDREIACFVEVGERVNEREWFALGVRLLRG
jgi:hypothetical protein